MIARIGFIFICGNHYKPPFFGETIVNISCLGHGHYKTYHCEIIANIDFLFIVVVKNHDILCETIFYINFISGHGYYKPCYSCM